MDLMKDIQNRVKQYSPVWQRWNINEEIGRGDHSAVFLSSAEGEKEKAVKIITIKADESLQLSDIEMELQKLEQLNDCKNTVGFEAHTIKILRNSQDKKILGYDLLLQMKYLYSLEQMIEEGRRFTEAEIIELGIDLARGLLDARKKGIFHGSLKPSNIFAMKRKDQSLVFCLADFESSVLKRRVSKTPSSVAYMAPEVYTDGISGDIREDIYSLGFVLFQLLNHNQVSLINRAGAQHVERRELPELKGIVSDVDEVVIRCCASNKSIRYESLEKLAVDLEKCGMYLRRNQKIPKNAESETKNIKKKEIKKEGRRRRGSKGDSERNKWILAGCLTVAMIGLATVAGGRWLKNRSSVPTLAKQTEIEQGTSIGKSMEISQTAGETVTAKPTETTVAAPMVFEGIPELKAVYYSQNQWQEMDIAAADQVSLGNNGIGFVDLDQDGTLEFIYGYASKMLNNVDSSYYMKYHVYDLKGSEPVLLGTTDTLSLYFNSQESRHIFFANVYVEGTETAEGFSGCIESNVAGLSDGKLQSRKMFMLTRNRPTGSQEEQRAFFTYDNNAQQQEITYTEYEAALNTFTLTLQPAQIPLVYTGWNTAWTLEQKQSVLEQLYEQIK